MKYLDPVAISKLRHLKISPRHMGIEGHMTGMHQSRIKGFSQEFAQHREYVPGDDPKFLDWKVYARKDRFFIREYDEERNLNAYLLVDASGSMGFSGKFDYACHLAMAMAYLILEQKDAVGLCLFDKEIQVFLSPRDHFSALERMDDAFASTRPAKETDLGGVLQKAIWRISKRSLLIVFSDLLGDVSSIQAVFKACRAQGHSLMILHVLDPMERDFPFEGPVLFESMEDGSRLRCEASLFKAAYREEFDRYLKLCESAFRESGISYQTFYTNLPWDQSLGSFLAKA